MENHEIDDLLQRVQRVDAPPFLFTRIEARVGERAGARMPRPGLVAIGSALAILVLVNVLVVGRTVGEEDTVVQLVDGLGLQPSNQLYP